MKFKKTAALFVLTAVICASSTLAGSIYAKRNKNLKSYYADDTARKVGDILTIIVSEMSTIESETERKLNKTTSRDASWDGQLGIKSKLLPITPELPTFNISNGSTSSNKLDGKTEFSDEREITDRFTVTVEDIHPNGNLVIIGEIQRNIAGDKQIINIGGIVRPSDITFANTVKSEQIAGFYMAIKNEGVSETYNTVGWVGRILDFIWPF